MYILCVLQAQPVKGLLSGSLVSSQQPFPTGPGGLFGLTNQLRQATLRVNDMEGMGWSVLDAYVTPLSPAVMPAAASQSVRRVLWSEQTRCVTIIRSEEYRKIQMLPGVRPRYRCCQV